ncbi:MAG: hypothetical protein PHV06_01155 [bacterium]|nr:hypothetical protein [bacterium]
MKRSIVILFILYSFVIITFSESFYYYNGNKVILQENNEYKIIQISSDFENNFDFKSLNDDNKFSKLKFGDFLIISNNDYKNNNLKNEKVFSLFYCDNNEVIITDEILIRTNCEITNEMKTVIDIKYNINSMKKIDEDLNIYLIKLKVRNSFETLIRIGCRPLSSVFRTSSTSISKI